MRCCQSLTDPESIMISISEAIQIVKSQTAQLSAEEVAIDVCRGRFAVSETTMTRIVKPR